LPSIHGPRTAPMLLPDGCRLQAGERSGARLEKLKYRVSGPGVKNTNPFKVLDIPSIKR